MTLYGLAYGLQSFYARPRPCRPETLQTLDSVIVRRRVPGSREPKPWGPGPGSREPWRPKPWDPGSRVPGSRHGSRVRDVMTRESWGPGTRGLGSRPGFLGFRVPGSLQGSGAGFLGSWVRSPGSGDRVPGSGNRGPWVRSRGPGAGLGDPGPRDSWDPSRGPKPGHPSAYTPSEFWQKPTFATPNLECGWKFRMLEFIPGPCPLGPRFLAPCPPASWVPWGPGSLGAWSPGPLGPWVPGCLGHRVPGSHLVAAGPLGSWDPGAQIPGCLGAWVPPIRSRGWQRGLVPPGGVRIKRLVAHLPGHARYGIVVGVDCSGNHRLPWRLSCPTRKAPRWFIRHA